MSLSTRADLDTEINNWLNRTDLSSRYDRFIALLEADLRGKLYHRRSLVRATTNLIAGDEYLLLPPDFSKAHIFYLSSNDRRWQLNYLTQSQMLSRYPTKIDGDPFVFSIVGNEIWLFPTPLTSMVLEMNYFQTVPSLNTNTTNWLLSGYPDVYFYGMLAIAHKAVRNNNEAIQYQTIYDNALSTVLNDDIESSRDGGPLQITTDTRSF